MMHLGAHRAQPPGGTEGSVGRTDEGGGIRHPGLRAVGPVPVVFQDRGGRSPAGDPGPPDPLVLPRPAPAGRRRPPGRENPGDLPGPENLPDAVRVDRDDRGELAAFRRRGDVGPGPRVEPGLLHQSPGEHPSGAAVPLGAPAGGAAGQPSPGGGRRRPDDGLPREGPLDLGGAGGDLRLLRPAPETDAGGIAPGADLRDGDPLPGGGRLHRLGGLLRDRGVSHRLPPVRPAPPAGGLHHRGPPARVRGGGPEGAALHPRVPPVHHPDRAFPSGGARLRGAVRKGRARRRSS